MNAADSTRLSSAGKQASVGCAQMAVKQVPAPKQTESDFAMIESILDQLSALFSAIDDACEVGDGRLQQIRRLASVGQYISEDFAQSVGQIRAQYPAYGDAEVSHG